MKKFLLAMVVALFASTFTFAQSIDEYRQAFAQVCQQVTSQNFPKKSGNVTIEGLFYNKGTLSVRATVDESKTTVDKEFDKTVKEIKSSILGDGSDSPDGNAFYQMILVTQSSIAMQLTGSKSKKVRKHVVSFEELKKMFQ